MGFYLVATEMILGRIMVWRKETGDEMNIFIKLVQSSRVGLQAEATWSHLAARNGQSWCQTSRYTVAKHYHLQLIECLQCCRFCTWHSGQIRKKREKNIGFYINQYYFATLIEIPLSMKYIKIVNEMQCISMK